MAPPNPATHHNRYAAIKMNTALLITATLFIEIGIPIILMALICFYKEMRRYTVVQLGAVLPWLIFYLVCAIYYALNPNRFSMGFGFIFVMTFIFYCLSFVIGFLISLVPYPKSLKFRFIIGFASPFVLYGVREIWIIVGWPETVHPAAVADAAHLPQGHDVMRTITFSKIIQMPLAAFSALLDSSPILGVAVSPRFAGFSICFFIIECIVSRL